jgi:hypothetical protein
VIPICRNCSLWEFISRRAVAFAARLISEAGVTKGSNCSNIESEWIKLLKRKVSAPPIPLTLYFRLEDHDNPILACNLRGRVKAHSRIWRSEYTHWTFRRCNTWKRLMMSFTTLFKAWPMKTIKLVLHRRQKRSLKYPCAGLHWRKVVHRVKRIKDLLRCPTIQTINQKRRKYTLEHSPATDSPIQVIAG